MTRRRWRKAALAAAVLVLVAAILGLVLTGWPARAGNGQKHIIYVHKTILNEIQFWRSVNEGITAGAQEFGHKITIFGPPEEMDIEGNIEALQRAAALKPDAIVLVASDYERLAPYAEQVREQGIPLLTLDSDVRGDIAQCFVGTDNYKLGQQMAEELMRRMPQGGTVGLVGHVAEVKTAIDRVAGVYDTLDAAQFGTLLEPVYCNNKPSTARELAAAMLEQHPELTGLVATNERSALGISEAVAASGRQDEVTVVTCDNASRLIEYLEQGVIDATVVQKPFDMGYLSVRMVDELLGGGAVPAFYDTGCEVITLENYFTLENQKLLFPVWE